MGKRSPQTFHSTQWLDTSKSQFWERINFYKFANYKCLVVSVFSDLKVIRIHQYKLKKLSSVWYNQKQLLKSRYEKTICQTYTLDENGH